MNHHIDSVLTKDEFEELQELAGELPVQDYIRQNMTEILSFAGKEERVHLDLVISQENVYQRILQRTDQWDQTKGEVLRVEIKGFLRQNFKESR